MVVASARTVTRVGERGWAVLEPADVADATVGEGDDLPAVDAPAGVIGGWIGGHGHGDGHAVPDGGDLLDSGTHSSVKPRWIPLHDLALVSARRVRITRGTPRDVRADQFGERVQVLRLQRCAQRIEQFRVGHRYQPTSHLTTTNGRGRVPGPPGAWLRQKRVSRRKRALLALIFGTAKFLRTESPWQIDGGRSVSPYGDLGDADSAGLVAHSDHDGFGALRL